MDVVPIVDEGLGNASWLVDLGDGGALVVDPSRDPRPYLREADKRGLAVRFAADTHLHADFVSGTRELAGLGARLLAPAAAGLAFPHDGVADGDDVDVGGLRLRVVATPGHSPEHVAYLLFDGQRPVAAFTGGALIVGGVARTDLNGPRRTDELSRLAYRSVWQRLFTLPDDVEVFPTHGPGSFCSAGQGGERSSTIGRERAANPLLTATDEDAFVADLRAGLGSYPSYFDWTPALNRRGAPRHGTRRPVLARVTPADARRRLDAGAVVVDARPITAFADGHIPGAVSIAARPVFATWLGWLVDPERPVIVVLDEDQDRDALVEACLKVGYHNLLGEVDGGMPAWTAAGGETRRLPLVDAGALAGRRVLDVRQRGEFAAGHVPGANHCELGDLAVGRRTPVSVSASVSASGDATTVMCGHGERAMTAASVLAAAGHPHLAVLRGGPGEWQQTTRRPLAIGAGEDLEG